MNALLFAHVGIRSALLGRAVLWHGGKLARRSRLLVVVLALATLEVAVRLFLHAGQPSGWTMASLWTPLACTDLLLTIALVAAQRRSPHRRKLAERQAEALRLARLAGERAAAHRIADAVADLAEEDSSKSELVRGLRALHPEAEAHETAHPVDAAMARVVRELRQAAPPGVDVRLDLDAELGPLHVDRGDLRDALHRLGRNAVLAMPAGGTLRLRASVSRVPANNRIGVEPGHWLRIELSDTGVGMDEADLQRARDPFFSTRSGTAGLGLSAVDAFVRGVGGVLELESEPGRGTTATLWLPAAPPSMRRVAARAPMAALTTTP